MLRQLVEQACRAAKNARVRGFKKLQESEGQVAFAEVQLTLSDAETSDLKSFVTNITTQTLDLPENEFRHIKDIVYTGIEENEDVSITTFVIPKGKRIPVHDHPHMTVFTKVLWGELEIRSYDFIGNKVVEMGRGGIAIEHAPLIVRPGEVVVLKPENSNIHEFRARKNTAVFDVAVPPYDSDHGRPCHYYAPSDIVDSRMKKSDVDGSMQEERKVYMKRVECPDDYYTVNREYTGEQP